MKRWLGSLFLIAVLGLPAPVRAQSKLLPAAIGGVLGTGAGGYVALGIVTLRARRGRYLFVFRDAFGWDSAPLLAGGGTGVILGFWDVDRLRDAVVGTAVGAVVGTGVGALVGRHIWSPPEGKWAGGVIGGGAGVLLGAGAGILMPPSWMPDWMPSWNKNDNEKNGGGVPVAIKIPVGQ